MSTPPASNSPAPSSPRKRLPVNPSLEHLKRQAKRLARQLAIPLTQAQHRLANEYGAKTWPELAHMVETMSRGATVKSGPSSRNFEPLPAAANKNDLAKVREILSAGPFTQHDLDLALARAVLRFNERKEIAKLLIDHGADPDGQYGANYGPIVFVTGECLDPDGLQFLIDHGADVTFPPVATKYGGQCPLSYFLGAYVRGQNDRKHRGIDILLQHHAHIPAEVTPEILAIHRGDARVLAAELDKDPTLLTRRYPTMPYGNLLLAGSALLHCAVEFGEIECIDLLLARGADINSKADIIDNFGGQTPVFHAIGTCLNANFSILEHFLKRAGNAIDMSARASFKLSDGETIPPVSPLEYAQLCTQPETPDWRRSPEKEVALLRAHISSTEADHEQ